MSAAKHTPVTRYIVDGIEQPESLTARELRTSPMIAFDRIGAPTLAQLEESDMARCAGCRQIFTLAMLDADDRCEGCALPLYDMSTEEEIGERR